MRMRRAASRTARGFTLVEMAVVFTIASFLLASALYVLSAQVDQRNFQDTQRRLDQARELLLSFSIVNGRLPCPARYVSAASNSQGLESFCAAAAPATCSGSETTTVQTHGNCSNYDGYLPAASLGTQQTDANGFATDTWGNRIRYTVAKAITNCSTSPPANTILFTNSFSPSNLKTYGITCQPSDLVVCKSGTGVTATSCGGVANQIMTQNLVVAIAYATGKNGSTTGGTGTDEAKNLDGNVTYVYHTPTPSTAANGEFDDQFTWISVGELYARMIAGGVLP